MMTERRKRAATEAGSAACARRCIAVVVGMHWGFTPGLTFVRGKPSTPAKRAAGAEVYGVLKCTPGDC